MDILTFLIDAFLLTFDIMLKPFGLSGNLYRVALLSKLYLIIIPIFKSGQDNSNMHEFEHIDVLILNVESIVFKKGF